MRKKGNETKSSAQALSLSKRSCKDSLRKLQIELVKLQRHSIKCDDEILVILEGRDTSERYRYSLVRVVLPPQRPPVTCEADRRGTLCTLAH